MIATCVYMHVSVYIRGFLPASLVGSNVRQPEKSPNVPGTSGFDEFGEYGGQGIRLISCLLISVFIVQGYMCIMCICIYFAIHVYIHDMKICMYIYIQLMYDFSHQQRV